MRAIAIPSEWNTCWMEQCLKRLMTAGLFIIGWGCAANGQVAHTVPPDWLNSVLTAQARIEITPAMSVSDRLSELRRAKEAAYDQLKEEVLSLPISDQRTIGQLVNTQPQLRQQIESYIRRVAVVDMDQHVEPEQVRTRIEVGSELLNLLHLKTAPAPADRNTPSTGIVRPLN
jgi:(p)ppGpp synthase/HD superfamily hydrolase